MNIGFIGLGNMGGPMATHLLEAGHTLVCHDLRRQAATPLLEMGATWADTPEAVAQASEITFTSLPAPRDVEEVALGEQGILRGGAPGSVYIDLSTNYPAVVRRIHDACRERGMHMLDAPVSGGVPGARTRDLGVFVGGDEAVYRRCKPVLDTIGDKVYYTGAIGTGTICKLVSNAIGFVYTQTLIEGFTLGVKAGVDPQSLWEAVRRSAVGRGTMLHRMPQHLFQGNFEPSFALKLARKDIGLALDLAREYQVPVELMVLTEQRLVAALNRGWGEKDSTIAMVPQEERAGVQLRVPPFEPEA
ncbi:MAG: NAD(P)-dependent oxidoreductase [Dehalococcoidia bacterium]